MDNVVLSILQPFHWRVQGFTLSLPLSLYFLGAIGGGVGVGGEAERGAPLKARLSVCNEA